MVATQPVALWTALASAVWEGRVRLRRSSARHAWLPEGVLERVDVLDPAALRVRRLWCSVLPPEAAFGGLRNMQQVLASQQARARVVLSVTALDPRTPARTAAS